MEILFESLAEDAPGPIWQARFRELWPAYRTWFLSEGIAERATWRESVQALRLHMPELLPVYERLCTLAGGSDLSARFLTLWRPPPYVSGCSQVAWTGAEPALIRNYDYAPALCDGLILKSAWNGRGVIAKLDCLWGCLDGINADGLALSLTFGGRRAVGPGFGIPIVLRYLLEFCRDTRDAADALPRVPVHMAYNVTAIDRAGAFFTAQLGPDRPPSIRPVAVATNHQDAIEWHHHAQATLTLERERHLAFRLADPAMNEGRLADAFLAPPLYARAWRRGFGTLYTAHYRPGRGEAVFRWPGHDWPLAFDRFAPERRRVTFGPETTGVALLLQDAPHADPEPP
jgi:predicted choloylglycine hydrolase